MQRFLPFLDEVVRYVSTFEDWILIFSILLFHTYKGVFRRIVFGLTFMLLKFFDFFCLS